MKLSLFPSNYVTKVPSDCCIDYEWDDIAEFLLEFQQTDSKDDTKMYNLWEFKVENGEIHRCADACIALHGLVLDYDQNLSLNDALYQFDGYECVFYTTYNHRRYGKDKYRIVIPFTHPMPVEEFKKKRTDMMEFFPGVDPAAFSLSQVMYLHSGYDKTVAFSARMNGIKLDWTIFKDEEIIPYIPSMVPQTIMDTALQTAYKEAVINSLKSCSGIRHLDALSLVIILKSCGGTFEEYCEIVSIVGDKDSSIHKMKSKQQSWEKIPPDVRIRKETRDKYIQKHNGKPVVMEYNLPTNKIITDFSMIKNKIAF